VSADAEDPPKKTLAANVAATREKRIFRDIVVKPASGNWRGTSLPERHITLGAKIQLFRDRISCSRTLT
jgi:hypothetical protein